MIEFSDGGAVKTGEGKKKKNRTPSFHFRERGEKFYFSLVPLADFSSFFSYREMLETDEFDFYKWKKIEDE